MRYIKKEMMYMKTIDDLYKEFVNRGHTSEEAEKLADIEVNYQDKPHLKEVGGVDLSHLRVDQTTNELYWKGNKLRVENKFSLATTELRLSCFFAAMAFVSLAVEVATFFSK